MKDLGDERSRRDVERFRRSQVWPVAIVVLAIVTVYALGIGHSAARTMEVTQLLPDGAVGWVIGAVGALILLHALYTAGSTALELLRPLHIKVKRESHPKRAMLLQTLLDRRAESLAACTVGSQACVFFMAVLSFSLAPGISVGVASRTGWGSYAALLATGMLIAIPVWLANLVFGELVPKSLAAAHPHFVLSRLNRFLRFARIMFAVPARLVTLVGGLITTRFGGTASFAIENQAEEEIKEMVAEAQESGGIESDERELIHSVFEFTDTVAREVMTPRMDMHAMPIDSTPVELIELIKSSGHSRIPIYEDADDHIIGIVHAKDILIAQIQSGGEFDMRSLLRPAMFVPETKNLRDLLTEMRKSRNHLAVVQDEFGDVAGIVTIEDIVEELVGDISDEYDIDEEPITVHGEGFLIDAKTHVDDVNHSLGTQFETEEFDTLGGYVFGLFGRQPAKEEVIESDGWRFTVVDTDGRRILKLFIEHVPVETAVLDDDEDL